MTYAAKETSRQAGRPAELYVFTQAAAPALPVGHVVFSERFTHADATARDVAWDGLVNADDDTDPAATIVTSGGFGGQPYTLAITPILGVGDFNGRVYVTRTLDGITPDLDPDTTYTFLAGVTLSRDVSPIIAGASYGGRAANGDDFEPPADWLDEAGQVFTVSGSARPNADGTLVLVIGAKNIQTGNAAFTVRCHWITLSAPLTGFAAAAATTVRLTSYAEDYTFDANVYTSTTLQRGPIRRGGLDSAPEEIEVTLPRDHTVAGWVRDGLPATPVTCTLIRTHVGETESVTPALTWQVVQARFDGPACVLTLGSIRSITDRTLPIYSDGPACPYPLYGTLCQASEAANTYTATVNVVAGLEVTIEAADVTAIEAASGQDFTVFAGGVLVTTSGYRVGIRAVTGGVLTLSRSVTLAATDAVALTVGCDKTPLFCHRVHGNLIHFGGKPFVPARNPYGQGGLTA